MATTKKRLRELRAELQYWQMMVRKDIRSLRATIKKCKEVGAEMRRLQEENRKNPD